MRSLLDAGVADADDSRNQARNQAAVSTAALVEWCGSKVSVG